MDNIIIYLLFIQTIISGFFVYTYYTHVMEFNRIRKYTNRVCFGVMGVCIGIIGVDVVGEQIIHKLNQIKKNIKDELLTILQQEIK